MQIIAVRHLKTTINTQGRLQGRWDTDIDQKELNEAEIDSNLRLLNQLIFDKVCVSPMKRTIQTASIYGFDDFEIDENLIEFDFGRFEMKPKKTMLNEIGDIWFNEFDSIDLGETKSQLENRILTFIGENEHLETILVFSHGVVIRYMMALSGLISTNQVNRLNVKNNSVNLINF